MNIAHTLQRALPLGYKVRQVLSLKSPKRTRRLELSILVAFAACGFGFAPAQATVLFNDTFQDGDLAAPQWRNNNGNSGTATSPWTVSTDPDTSYPTNKVLMSGAASTTHSINATGTNAGGSELVATWRINISQTGNNSWNSLLRLLTTTVNSDPTGGDGYEVYVTGATSNNLQIRRADSFSTAPTVTTLATGTVSLISGWNTFEFHWKPNGELWVSVNGGTHLTATDTTYAPQFSRIYINNYLNNAGVTGRVLYYDDIQVADTVVVTGWVGDPSVTAPGNGASPTNPHISRARYNVARAAGMTNFGTTGGVSGNEIFWLAWGYCAPESATIGDSAIGSKALANLDLLCNSLQTTPQALWESTYALEAVRLLAAPGPQQQTSATINGWLIKLQPSVDLLDATVYTTLPNANAQAAHVLELAAQLYAALDPTSAAVYRSEANTIIGDLVGYQMINGTLGGAFKYVYSSGPSEFYDAFTTVHLGRYYQLARAAGQPFAQAGDPCFDALTMLTNMASAAKYYQANGVVEDSSAPWWKHSAVASFQTSSFNSTWGATPSFCNDWEIVSGAANDSGARAIAQYRINLAGSIDIDVFTAMYFWDPWIPSGGLGLNFQGFNYNSYGPIIRNGLWQVSLPGRDYGDASVSAVIANSTVAGKYDAALQSASLPVIGTKENFPYGWGAMVMPFGETTSNRTISTADSGGWVAKGWTYHPAESVTSGPTVTVQQDWRHDEVFYSDGAEVAGWMRVVKTGGSTTATIYGPKAYLKLGDSATVVGDKITTGAMNIRLFGYTGILAQLSYPQVSGSTVEPYQFWVDLPGAGSRTYAANATQFYGYGISATPSTATPSDVILISGLPDDLIGIKIMHGASLYRIVTYNTSPTTSYTVSASTLGASGGNVYINDQDAPIHTTYYPATPLGATVTIAPHKLMIWTP